MVRCLLCQTGYMPANGAKHHFNGSKHSAAFHRVKNLENEYVEKEIFMVTVQNRLENLGLDVWRWRVKAALYDVSRGARKDFLAVLRMLERYEIMEILSLLELALWKAQICDGLTFSSVQEMREYQILDENFDPTNFAMEMRAISGSAVIIPLVKSFLS